MARYAFQLRIRAGKEEEYDREHTAVFPELLQDLAAAGVQEYSIFRRGQQLFLYLLVPDFAGFMERMAQSESNRRWQRRMAELFEPVPGLLPGEDLAMMQEVFYLQGNTTTRDGNTEQ